ncbi:Ankyrin repeats (3 copies) [Popillia japonica]|uniref:Ankyrin repeats (3 copies) n=1 Tax=Popillia japonica TaxID=7064 RepID=A0AAW1HX14_POPJA
MIRSECEHLIARLADYTLLPTTTVNVDRKLADEWNQLTLMKDVTIVNEDSHIEQSLFGCILRKIDVITVAEWNDSVCNAGKLHHDVVDKFKVKSIEVDTLMGLLLELWIRGEIPLILKTHDSLPILGEFSYLNKNYVVIDSAIEKRYEEMKNYNLQVFSHIHDLQPETLLKMTSISTVNNEKHVQNDIEGTCELTSLHTAVTTGNLQTVKTLLNLGQDVNVLDEDRYSFLHRAVEYKYEGIVRILLENQAIVNTVTKQGDTPLITAIERYQDTIFKLLLEHKADINFINSCGLTALYVAALERKWHVVSILLSQGAIAELPAAQTLLFNAVKTNNCNVVQKLLKDYTEIAYDDIPRDLARHDDTRKLIKTVSEDRARVNVIDEYETGNIEIEQVFLQNGKSHINGRVEVTCSSSSLLEKDDNKIEDKKDPGSSCLSTLTAGESTGATEIRKPLSDKVKTALLDLPKRLREKSNKLYQRTGFNSLIKVIERDDVIMVNKLLEYGADINKTDLLGVPPLSYAIKTKNKDVFEILLRKGVDINQKSRDQSTPLYVAVETENFEAVIALLSHGVEVNIVNNAGITPLCAAVKTENGDIINILLSNQADVNLVGKDGATPLITAIQRNNVGIIQLLLAHDADPNFIDECGVTPLYIAALAGNWFVVSVLLLHNAYTSIITCGKTLLFNAIRTGCTSLVKLLLTTQPTGTTEFTVFNDITMIIEEVVGNRANINQVNEQGFSPLHIAVARRNLAMVELLLEYKANVNLRDNFDSRLADYTLLPTTTVNVDRKLADEWNQLTLMKDVTIVNEDSHIEQSLFGCILRKIDVITVAEWNDSVCNAGKLHHDVVDKFKVKSIEVDTLMGHIHDLQPETLLKMTSISTVNNEKHVQNDIEGTCELTSFHTAVTTGNLQTVKTLLNLGQDVNVQDEDRYSFLHRAVEYKYKGIVRILLENQAIVNTVTKQGDTPLITAIEKYQDTIFKLLLEHKADINFINSCGLTALYVAALERKWHVVSILLSQGAIAELPAAQTLLFNAVKTNNCNVVQKLLKDYTEIAYDDIPRDLARHDDTRKLIKTVSEDRARVNVIDEYETGNIEIEQVFLQNGKSHINGRVEVTCSSSSLLEKDDNKIEDKKDPGSSCLSTLTAGESTGATEIRKPLSDKVKTALLDLPKRLREKSKADSIESGHNSLFNAVETRNMNIVEKMLVAWPKEHNCNVNANTSFSKFDKPQNLIDIAFDIRPTVNSINEQGLTPLIKVIERDDVIMVNKLLEYGADINKTDLLGVPPLSYAIKTKNKDVFEILLRKGVDINQKSRDQSTPLYVAVETENFEAVIALLSHGVEVNIVNNAGITPLCAAVKTENGDIINILLSNQADVNLVGKDGATPLITAIQRNNVGIIQLLLAHDADPNFIDECGVTPLYIAALAGNWFVVSVLLLHNAYTSIITCGKTLLFNAIRTGCTSLVKLLLTTQPTGTTEFTVFNDITMIIEEVVGNRANINQVNEQGFSPLHIAVARRNLAMVELLLEYKANVNLRDNFDCTVLDIARRTKQKNIIEALCKQKHSISKIT